MMPDRQMIDISEKQELAPQEKNRLQELEGTIKTNLKAFYEVGNALAEIRDSRLYRETHKTFEDYCRDRWDIARRTAYQMIESYDVVENVRHGAHKLPVNERQARPLTKLEPEQQVEAWQQAVETAPDGKVTAKHVKKVVNQITGEVKQEKQKGGETNENEVTETISEGEVAMKFARMAVMQLEEIRYSHHDREEAFNYVQEWINKNR